MNAYSGPPMTLGNAAAAHVRLIVWCLDCLHQTEPDPAEMAERYGAEMTVPDWQKRLVCGECGSRRVDMVVTGTERRGRKSPGRTRASSRAARVPASEDLPHKANSPQRRRVPAIENWPGLECSSLPGQPPERNAHTCRSGRYRE
jgi:hypothetical protein